jgi:phosphoglycerate kinase
MSLAPVAGVLGKLIKKSVQFIPDCIGEERNNAIRVLKAGDVVLLENLRFHAEEELNDDEFAKALSEGCDLYVDDAFSNCHRAHASMVAVAKYLPAYAGFSVQEEVDSLSKLFKEPKHPFIFISGGAKISDKIKILDNLIEKVDMILFGGAMANTFLCSQGLEIGCSLAEKENIGMANDILKKAEEKGVAVMLPEDVVVTKKLKENPKFTEKDIEDVESDDIIADIGSGTIKTYKELIEDAGMIFWNGTLGINEYPEFDRGSIEIGQTVAKSAAFSVIGGGDTVSALPEKEKEKFDFVSMAGGATMEFLEGKELPGLTVLK